MKKSRKVTRKLKGKELADYIKKNKKQLKGDGDKLCLDAGYGMNSNGGVLKCNLPLFIKEFSQAMSETD